MSSRGHGNHVRAGQTEDPALGLAGLEQQQALLLSALRRAAGAPVTYAELREAGIEFPASVVSELELASFPIRRCHGGAAGEPHAPAVRLDPADDLLPTVPEEEEVAHRPIPEKPTEVSGWDTVRVYRTTGGGAFLLASMAWLSRAAGLGRRVTAAAVWAGGAARRGGGAGRWGGRVRMPHTAGRWIAPVALLATIAVVVGFILIGLSGGGGHPRRAVVPRAPRQAVTASRGPHAVSRPRPATRVPPTPVSPALATDLEARGHGLLETGRYGDAVTVLRRALLATGERISACLEPDSSSCLTYAYALYDLGRALRLSGHAAAAVPILERRLRIDNQRPTVEAELQLARQGIT